MDYVYLIIGCILVLTCFYFITSPFFQTEKWVAVERKEPEGYAPLESIYQTMNELEMDYLMKKLSPQDYEQMKVHYQSLAAGYLQGNQMKAANRKEKVKDKIDDEITKELQKLRKGKG
ncbi:hypothetical protein LS684_16680 [Cytobacillus spongiae]|jgi:hypothetical protein|uniref:hypothetical protein n=1 Tax=Cytobacillus spongiae TaxID=2901381 RepID=UPI001F445686|nr:hypothetical protein [Cytobacillus spongiae]UII55275.1 hypothetical protein LS684_16680 [Cytobacillus spongiae]